MQLTTNAGRSALAAIVDDPGGVLVALDFDGTLAPIVDDPEQARAHPGAVPALVALARRIALIAIITGRPAAAAVEYAGVAGVAGLEGVVVLGQYGLDRWDAASGEVSSPPPHPGIGQARSDLPAALADADAGAAFIEDKGSALGVHTRRMPDPGAALDRLRAPLARLASECGLSVEPGKFVLELRPPGIDKGAALRSLFEERGIRTVVYVGDDLGDLAAFDAVDDLRARGIPGLLVCSGSTEQTVLADRADLVVDGPAGVVQLLRELAAMGEPAH